MSASNGIRIVSASESQCEACLPILSDSILDSYFDPPLAREILFEGRKAGNLFVAERGGETIGFFLRAPAGAFLVFPYLHLLAVKTSERGNGVGALLLDRFEALCLEAEGYPFRPKAFLLVSPENPRAIAFYERRGYAKKAEFENMFAEGDTEWLMMKDLGLKRG